MSEITVSAVGPLTGRIRVPGDKSISHRALMLSALGNGISHINGFLPGGDCLATKSCLQALGVQVDVHSETSLSVHGLGLHGLMKPEDMLNCVRSGTTIRLMSGILAGQTFDSILTGEEQLRRRPMNRVAAPLRQMGAQIDTTNGCPPILIHGSPLHGCEHRMEVASAQVKSALLLAGCYANSPTTVIEPGPARDHTERMLKAMGVEFVIETNTITIIPPNKLHSIDFEIPGDISSAAFPMVAGVLVPGSSITIELVGVNPTRTGLLEVLMSMGADIELQNIHEEGSEPVATLSIKSSQLKGVTVGGDTIVKMIDELPILAVAATQAHGTTTIHDASELRVKETDRIATTVSELKRLGAKIEALPDGFIIEGPTPLKGCQVSSHADHRLAMALVVAGLVSQGESGLDDIHCAADSFPGFIQTMQSLGGRYA